MLSRLSITDTTISYQLIKNNVHPRAGHGGPQVEKR